MKRNKIKRPYLQLPPPILSFLPIGSPQNRDSTSVLWPIIKRATPAFCYSHFLLHPCLHPVLYRGGIKATKNKTPTDNNISRTRKEIIYGFHGRRSPRSRSRRSRLQTRLVLPRNKWEGGSRPSKQNKNGPVRFRPENVSIRLSVLPTPISKTIMRFDQILSPLACPPLSFTFKILCKNPVFFFGRKNPPNKKASSGTEPSPVELQICRQSPAPAGEGPPKCPPNTRSSNFILHTRIQLCFVLRLIGVI